MSNKSGPKSQGIRLQSSDRLSPEEPGGLRGYCDACSDIRMFMAMKTTAMTMSPRAFARACAALCIAARLIAVVMATGSAWAASDVLTQNYPTRAIKIMTNSSAGGTYDIVARALASELHKRWGQPVIVEPRPGGNFMIAGRACAESTPDGYTLCALSGETLVYSEFLYKNVPYDPRRDFAPVTNLFFNTQVLVAAALLNVKTLDDLVLLGKTKPLAFSAPAVAQRLFLERLINEKGMNMVSVPFRGGGEAITALLNGSTPVLFSGGVNFP